MELRKHTQSARCTIVATMKHATQNAGEYRIACTGGGSGGHVYPALAVLERLTEQTGGKTLRVLWLGSKNGPEKAIVQELPQSENFCIEYCSISCGKLRRYASLRNFSDLFRISWGLWQSYRKLRRWKPSLLFSKGGFVSVPPLFAAKCLGIRALSHESDLDPGLATRLALPLVETLFLPYEQSKNYYPAKYRAKLEVSGNPVRREFFASSGDTAAKIAKGKRLIHSNWLDENGNLLRPMLLVLGGSLGAEELNYYVEQWLEQRESPLKNLYIVHQSGLKNAEKLRRLEQKYENYRNHQFVREGLGALYHLCRSSGGLVVSRAGAGSLWEILASRNRAVLVPLQSGSRGEQLRNARFFAQQGWAEQFVSQNRNGQKLLEQIQRIFHDNQAPKWGEIPDAAEQIAQKLWQLLHRP